MGRDSDLEEFGCMVANRRWRAGLTQEQFAARTALSVRTVRNIECGATRARVPTLHQIAEARLRWYLVRPAQVRRRWRCSGRIA
jgi:transcriptional regulator with XRE-family HTH domain